MNHNEICCIPYENASMYRTVQFLYLQWLLSAHLDIYSVIKELLTGPKPPPADICSGCLRISSLLVCWCGVWLVDSVHGSLSTWWEVTKVKGERRVIKSCENPMFLWFFSKKLLFANFHVYFQCIQISQGALTLWRHSDVIWSSMVLILVSMERGGPYLYTGSKYSV